MTTTYWHCADASYTGGPILSTQAQLDRGWDVEDKWTDDPYSIGATGMDPGDYSLVSVWRDDQRAEIAWMLESFPGLVLVRVDLPDDVDVTHDAEGNTAIVREIPAEYLTTITDPTTLAAR